ncbi:MAG: hypothetical protein IPL65_17490 [Lewinellaceae bacterium]|nr:hypothetical protein [Lewinellaceae bacterium]
MTNKTIVALLVLIHLSSLAVVGQTQDVTRSRFLTRSMIDTSPFYRSAPWCIGGSGYQNMPLNPNTNVEMEPARFLRAQQNATRDSLFIEFDLEDPAIVRFQMINEAGQMVFDTPNAAQSLPANRNLENSTTGTRELPANDFL